MAVIMGMKSLVLSSEWELKSSPVPVTFKTSDGTTKGTGHSNRNEALLMDKQRLIDYFKNTNQ